MERGRDTLMDMGRNREAQLDTRIRNALLSLFSPFKGFRRVGSRIHT
jgi:hypothetical protein